ncbi:hypothetical protein [Xenorhabdus bovienii]|uniref:DUF2971 domain-containing protein n=1 Tax=Xenorhabdus bovienii str. Intermedium TaxID=1379677 RepID=A0A077Q8Z4_XENBV|nr:hypothetical protein [Xenorhabdus bovienii]CDH32752.1 conserved hypothetical protein [Xenorhabdus bovienii str. Intermedium]
MPAITDPEILRQPIFLRRKLWRYMDFTKFVSLISSNNLFLSRIDKFRDPYEGMLPKENELIKQKNEQKTNNSYRDTIKHNKEKYYANCWYASRYESAAMWVLYAKTNEAIAIETNYQILSEELPDYVYLGLVSYIDYKKKSIKMHSDDSINSMNIFMYKRKSFLHEKEARIIMSIDNIDKTKQNHEGVYIPINLNKLIKKIHIAPDAPSWFEDLVKDIAIKHSIKAPVIKSSLYLSPDNESIIVK